MINSILRTLTSKAPLILITLLLVISLYNFLKTIWNNFFAFNKFLDSKFPRHGLDHSPRPVNVVTSTNSFGHRAASGKSDLFDGGGEPASRVIIMNRPRRPGDEDTMKVCEPLADGSYDLDEYVDYQVKYLGGG